MRSEDGGPTRGDAASDGAARPRELQDALNFHLYHPLARRLARRLIRTPVTPNAVSIAGGLLVVAATLAYAQPVWAVGGASRNGAPHGLARGRRRGRRPGPVDRAQRTGRRARRRHLRLREPCRALYGLDAGAAGAARLARVAARSGGRPQPDRPGESLRGPAATVPLVGLRDPLAAHYRIGRARRPPGSWNASGRLSCPFAAIGTPRRPD